MTANATEEEPAGKMLVCSHCPKEFRYNSEKIRHEMSHSPGFQCEVCSKKFSFISALRRHQKQHERTGSVKCEECNRKFRDEVLLKRHIKYAHKGTFTCTKCNAPFSSDQALRTHMKSHKPESERRFKCSFNGCTKSFNFSHHLKHHELTHTNDKQHFCSVCGKGFIQSHHLKTHLKTHDPAEWLYCEIAGCEKKFSTEYARKRHMVTHKIKPDSGISSDSSSCEAFITSKELTKDSILCASCGEHIHEADYAKHSANCGNISHSFMTIASSPTTDLRQEFEQTLSLVSGIIIDIKSENDFDTVPVDIKTWTLHDLKQNDGKVVKSAPIFDRDIGECRTAPGGCIMGPDNCVCVEISKPIDKKYDFTPIDDSSGIVTIENDNRFEFPNVKQIEHDSKNFEHNNNDVILTKDMRDFDYVQNNMNRSMCEGCDCASICDLEPTNCRFRTVNNNIPNIEYSADGVVKIKDTFDVDIPITLKSEFKNDSYGSYGLIGFSTCRDAIGNCIAGGSEGCLCAKMMMDNQEATAQEIDDITPKPKTEN